MGSRTAGRSSFRAPSFRLAGGLSAGTLLASAALLFALVGLTPGRASARYGGHPGATGNGATCNRCHSPQTYDGLNIVLPAEYRRDCYEAGPTGYKLVNSFYVLPYSDVGAGTVEVPVRLALEQPPEVPQGGDEPGLFCPTINPLNPPQECTTPADCTTGDLCQDFGATETVLTALPDSYPGQCRPDLAPALIEEICGAGRVCAQCDCNDEGCNLCRCATREQVPYNSCGRTMPSCDLANPWAGFAIEVTGTTAGSANVLKPAPSEGAAKQADNGGAPSTTEVNHSEPKAFTEGEASWDLLFVSPPYNPTTSVQSVTFYASANACNHNFEADVGDITAVTQKTVFFQRPGEGEGHTGPVCLEAPVCAPGQVLDGALACRCPNGFRLGDRDGDGVETCEASCTCVVATGREGAASAALLLGALALVGRRRRRPVGSRPA